MTQDAGSDEAMWTVCLAQSHHRIPYLCTEPKGHTGTHRCEYAAWPNRTWDEPTHEPGTVPFADQGADILAGHDVSVDVPPEQVETWNAIGAEALAQDTPNGPCGRCGKTHYAWMPCSADASPVPPGQDLFQWRYSTEVNRMVRPRLRDDNVPTRIDVRWRTKAEEAIAAAAQAVEAEGASEALTKAVTLLNEARERVADHAEGVKWSEEDGGGEQRESRLDPDRAGEATGARSPLPSSPPGHTGQGQPIRPPLTRCEHGVSPLDAICAYCIQDEDAGRTSPERERPAPPSPSSGVPTDVTLRLCESERCPGEPHRWVGQFGDPESASRSCQTFLCIPTDARAALALCIEAIDKHHEWCGNSPEAPGSSIWYRAKHAAEKALAATDSAPPGPDWKGIAQALYDRLVWAREQGDSLRAWRALLAPYTVEALDAFSTAKTTDTEGDGRG